MRGLSRDYLRSMRWKSQDVSSRNQWLKKALDFMIKTPFVFILTLITSYMRLLSKINDNEPAKGILSSYIFGHAKAISLIAYK